MTVSRSLPNPVAKKREEASNTGKEIKRIFGVDEILLIPRSEWQRGEKKGRNGRGVGLFGSVNRESWYFAPKT